MLTNYVLMMPIRSESTEEIIKAYLTGVYSTFGGSKYIMSNLISEFTSKQFTLLAKELDVLKVYTSPYTPHRQFSHITDTLFSKSIYKKTHM